MATSVKFFLVLVLGITGFIQASKALSPKHRNMSGRWVCGNKGMIERTGCYSDCEIDLNIVRFNTACFTHPRCMCKPDMCLDWSVHGCRPYTELLKCLTDSKTGVKACVETGTILPDQRALGQYDNDGAEEYASGDTMY